MSTSWPPIVNINFLWYQTRYYRNLKLIVTLKSKMNIEHAMTQRYSRMQNFAKNETDLVLKRDHNQGQNQAATFQAQRTRRKPL